MPTVTLTDKLCEKVRPPEFGRAEYFDPRLPGFGLRVSDKGRKTFCLLYRVNGIKRRLTIGPYTGAGSLKTARDRARKALEAAAEGRDPATEKGEARGTGDTVGRVVESYWQRHLAALKDGQKVKRILEREVVSRWRHRRIGHITRREIIELIDEVTDRGTPGSADKVRGWVHALMNWCLSRDLLEHNPAAGLRRPHTPQIRSRVLGDDELRAIWQAAEGLGYPFGPVLQLLMLTGQRRGEVCRMRWADIDLGESVWFMGDTKGGHPHVVPLPGRACAILGALPRLGQYVFTTRRDRPVSGLSKAKERLDKAAEVPGFHTPRSAPYRAHGAVSARLREAHLRPGARPRHAGRESALRPLGISPTKRAALDAWAAELERIVEGGAAKAVGIR